MRKTSKRSAKPLPTLQTWLHKQTKNIKEKNHNTKQYTYTGEKARYDCLIIKGGIKEPEGKEVVVKKLEVDEQKETPISDYYVDDSKIIDEMFGGQDDRN